MAKPIPPNVRLAFRLDILSNLSKRSANRIYEAEYGLNVNDLRLLRLIRVQPGIGPSELADMARFDRPKTSRMLPQLIGRGLIERRAAEGDGRQVELHLTEAGRKLVDHSVELSERLEAALLKPLSEEERTMLVTILEKLTTWVETGEEVKPFHAGKGVRNAPAAADPG